MRGFGKFAGKPAKKPGGSVGGGTGSTSADVQAMWPSLGPFKSTNLVKPGIAVNEYSGLPWGSGSSGQFTPSGDFATYRGRADDMIGAHSDNNDDALELWSFRQDYYYQAPNWAKHIDITIGAFGKNYSGNLPQETWKGAGRGDYDARWAQTLQHARSLLHTRVGPNGRPPKVFIRFAHEWNGNWYPWSASNYWLYSDNIWGSPTREVSTKADFKAAWVRFRALQRQYYPESYIVCNVNRTGEGWSATADNPSGKWTDFMPDPDTYDVYGVDYYNWYNTILTQAEWDASLDELYAYDCPKGIRAHKNFAISQGKPMSHSEWGCSATGEGQNPANVLTPEYPGDSPVFINNMRQWFAANAGTGPGQTLYELYWNVEMGGGDQSGAGDDKFHLFSDPTKYVPGGRAVPPLTKLPKASQAYRNGWYNAA